MTPTISYITVTFNSAQDLRDNWKAPVAEGVEWIVVDNASADGSADVARELGARVISLPENVGFSAANNIGVDSCSSDVLIFVNPDVRVDDEGSRSLAKIATQKGAIVAPQLVNLDGSPQENGRRAPYLLRKVAHFLGLKSSARDYEVSAGASETVEVSWVMGAAVAVTRAVFERIGRWNDKYFVYYEDAELCLRARKRGVTVLLVGSVRWHHAWARATRRTFSWTPWKLELRSALRFYGTFPELLLPPSVGRWLGTIAARDSGTGL